MTTYFTADTHFGHNRTLNLSRRPFNNVIEMDRTIVDNWNSVVGVDDTIYHLGDFGDTSKLDILVGNIVFLPGNYDYLDTLNAVSKTCEIIKPNIILDVEYEGESHQLALIHEPDEAVGEDQFFLFGHIHKLQMVKCNGLNVGVDCHDFTPISLKTVLFYKNAVENHYNENVFIQKMAIEI